MSQWTDSARAKLEDYLARMRQSLAASGADVNEVADDLQRHVEEEIAARKLVIVTEQDVAQILARIGSPETGTATAAHTPASPSPPNRVPAGFSRKVSAGLLLFFGVILPLGTVVFEFLTGACAGVLFDPIPTMAHLLLVTLVPLANLAVWMAVARSDHRWRAGLGWANAFAIGIALVYALLFLPVTPFAAIGIVVYGFGFVPLAPLLALVCALVLRGQLRRTGGDAPLPGLWGLPLGVAALALLAFPTVITKAGLQIAASDSPAESTRGVRWLRAWGQNEELLRACYGRAGRGGRLYSWGKYVSPEAARTIYYRVNGHPFNSVPPPKLYAGRARWNLVEQEFTWDDDQAGDAVAGRVRGLSLLGSRLDGVIYPEAALAYIEWTLEFKNDSGLQREARAQIALPPGAVVSRLTLWIDGEERQAAFGGRSQVKTAYKEVVQQRRDPVLVTTSGPDRVLMQCFPVPPNGGHMKLRLGITAPLTLLTAADIGYLRWPCFAERNFTIPEQFLHSLWMESSQPIESVSGKLHAEPGGKPAAYALRGQVKDCDLLGPANIVRAQRPAEARQVWTKDTREDNGRLIRQEIVERPVASPDRLALVLDGTQGMDASARAIAAALTNLPPGLEVALLLASDGCEEIVPLQKATPDLCRRLAAWKFHSAGGHDNLPALIRAWDLAAQTKAGAIVWIHAPQPMLLSSPEPLRQRFERSHNPPLLIDVATTLGPDPVADTLDGLKSVHSLLRLGDLSDDLGRLFRSWNGRAKTLEFNRQRVESSEGNPPGTETSMHLARLWAAEEVARLCAAHHPAEAAQLAARYQLVTPVSGAVVLETQAQFQRAGLQPAAPESVPSVPEPSAGLLGLLALALLALRRR